jgi:3-dehydroquinate synthase
LAINKLSVEKITIDISGNKSEIFVGEKWQAAFGLVPDNATIIITDTTVNRLYGDRFPGLPVITVTPGEESKKMKVIEDLADQLLYYGIDRSGFILAIGGGVVCDIAGFVAAIYMRGIRCGYVSTTLLAQVDASTGGKTGVNLGITKNMLGVIRQPEFVICDTTMLKTLSEQEFLSGLSELIKTAIIGDKNLFEQIESSREEILSRNMDLMTTMIAKSVRFKGMVVDNDEKETGLRRILNFGHTFGHAIEIQKNLRHGFAVALGMELATEFSYERKLISIEDRDRITCMLRGFRLNEWVDLTDSQMETLITHDKKKSGNDINFVFIKGIGKAVIEKVSVIELLNFYRRYRDKK